MKTFCFLPANFKKSCCHLCPPDEIAILTCQNCSTYWPFHMVQSEIYLLNKHFNDSQPGLQLLHIAKGIK